ncbi:MAG: hypothetical protein LH613_15110 [Chamaesiphon sp.]|nr:hypothetical protein [Chamaesiphon sp.]
MSKFCVIELPVIDNRDFETHPGGAIAKYWLDLPDLGRCLIKADLRGAWVEKVTATLAEQIGLPVAGCELVERADGLKMVASPTYLAEDKLPLDLTDFSGSLRSSIESESSGTLSMNDLARRLMELKPEATKYWCDRIGEIDRMTIAATFARVPDGWASEHQMTFAIDVLVASRDRLLARANVPSVKPPETIVERQSISPKRSSPRR